ncbi:MAG: CinA family protein [Chloroflexi bacterium CFX7]|nr:CinA family protein [Chloroflexi bacterium CFX7]RIL01763.1 MAG: damage-inducible protein CinA [bacterium]
MKGLGPAWPHHNQNRGYVQFCTIADGPGHEYTPPMPFLLEDDALARTIGEALEARGWRVAVAETTAGGLISARLLSVAGASNWFDRGVVAYSGAAKMDALGVDRDLLRDSGAVSAPAVAAMAEGLRRRSGVDIAVAESGIAGPQGSRRSPKPVGSVVIAIGGPEGTRVEEMQFAGTRARVMEQIAEAALGMLLAEIRGNAAGRAQ